ncbi:MAG TPA: hypothetical protein VFI96_00770 [Longimicrobiaceae bacterium]|nr:hypothetical protein [Longimicrobiaceae bacterium]
MPVLSAALAAMTMFTPAPKAEPCSPALAGTSAEIALQHAREATGLKEMNGRVLHLETADAEVQDFQSDRTYAPFLSLYVLRDVWFDPATGAEQVSGKTLFVGSTSSAPSWVSTAGDVFMRRGATLLAVPQMARYTEPRRLLDVAAVLHDWSASGGARVVGLCEARDFPRLTLSRQTAHGEERLYLDPESFLPVVLRRTEPHYLWGDEAVEYVYSNWMRVDGASVAMTSFRVVDGAPEFSRTVTRAALLPADSAPAFAPPPVAPHPTTAPPSGSPAPRVDTVRVAPNAFLLVNRAYTSAVALARDTVFVLDATMSEPRARQDSAWIGTLFPGQHPLVVVVTDLAWPHVAGVRFWVANGATIVSHRTSRDFLQRVVERRWTLEPDLLEQRRARAPFRFRAVEEGLDLAGGALQLRTIGGIGSEGALMAFLPASGFLWAGDFVQDTKAPTAYALEVYAATRHAGFQPSSVAAMHIPLTPWDGLEEVLAPAATGGEKR